MKKILFAGLLVVFGSVGSLSADFVTYDLVWSGVPFGNSAAARGTLTWDTDAVQSGTFFGFIGVDSAVDLVVEVEGADSGNGTFFDDELAFLFFETTPEGVDLNQEIVGQPDFLGFTLISLDPNGPSSSGPFTLDTAGPSSNSLQLVSFAPASAIPEPISSLVLGIACSLSLMHRRRS
ncbi:MAG: hypothetical protein AAGA30_02300 [Planctomycetota bacterium]